MSYAHINKVWFHRLEPVLKFPGTSIAHVWHDTKLEAGHRFHDEIERALDRMDVFLCLVRHDFLASDYIQTVELEKALAREKKGEVVIVPLVIYDVNLREEESPLKDFQPLPEWGRCWLSYCGLNDHYQAAHQLIRTGPRQAIGRVQARRREM